MQSRSDLERELVALAERAAEIVNHIERAAKQHDASTVQDFTGQLTDIDREIDLVSFKLALVQEAAETVD